MISLSSYINYICNHFLYLIFCLGLAMFSIIFLLLGQGLIPASFNKGWVKLLGKSNYEGQFKRLLLPGLVKLIY